MSGSAKRPDQFFVLLHNMRSLLNVGSVFRTADAFGISKIFLSGYTGRPDNPAHAGKIAKTALGAEGSVPWEYRAAPAAIIRRLRNMHPRLSVVGLENNLGRKKPENLSRFRPSFPLLLVLGEEVDGIGRSLLRQCDELVEIPMSGQKESLNVSVAFGVAAYELSKKRHKSKK